MPTLNLKKVHKSFTRVGIASQLWLEITWNERPTRRVRPVISEGNCEGMVYLDFPVNKDIGISYGARKSLFAQDVWYARFPEDNLSNLPGNVRQMVQRQFLLKRPLNVLWAFLRMTIGLPFELVIKILLPNKEWKIWVPRPPPIRPMLIHGHTIHDRMPAYPDRRSGRRSNVN